MEEHTWREEVGRTWQEMRQDVSQGSEEAGSGHGKPTGRAAPLPEPTLLGAGSPKSLPVLTGVPPPPPCFFLRDLHRGMGAEGLFPPRSHTCFAFHHRFRPGAGKQCLCLSSGVGLGPSCLAYCWPSPAGAPRGHIQPGDAQTESTELLAGSRGAHRTAVPVMASHTAGRWWKHSWCVDTPSTAGLPSIGALSCPAAPCPASQHSQLNTGLGPRCLQRPEQTSKPCALTLLVSHLPPPQHDDLFSHWSMWR